MMVARISLANSTFSGQFFGLVNNSVLIRYHFDYEAARI
jgi:hypothetical protein